MISVRSCRTFQHIQHIRLCLQNKMVLSIEKTKTLFISNREKSVHINTNCNLANVKIGNTIIDEVNSTKLLGVNVDNTLSWTMQVAQVKKCTSYRLFLFQKMFTVYQYDRHVEASSTSLLILLHILRQLHSLLTLYPVSSTYCRSVRLEVGNTSSVYSC